MSGKDPATLGSRRGHATSNAETDGTDLTDLSEGAATARGGSGSGSGGGGANQGADRGANRSPSSVLVLGAGLVARPLVECVITCMAFMAFMAFMILGGGIQ